MVEASTPEPGVRDPDATGDAKTGEPGTFPPGMESPGGAMTVAEKALEREDRRRGTGAPVVPGVAGLAFGSDDFFSFVVEQKQRMAVV